MNTSQKKLALGMFGFIFISIILAFYYITHKPFDAQIALRTVEVLWNFISAGWILCLCGGIGYAVIKKISLPPLVNLSLQGLLGGGLCATTILIIGSLLGSPKIGFIVGTILLSLLFFRQTRSWLKQFSELAKLWQQSDRSGRILGGLAGLILAIALASALCPPTGYDAMVYHLTMPAEYLRSGHIVHLTSMYFSGMPQVVEMLYTWSMALGSMSAATTSGWMFGVLSLIGFLGLLWHVFGEKPAWVGVGCILGGYTLASSLSWGYIDWGGFAFGLGAIVMLWKWFDNGQIQMVILAGVFAGLTLGTKYTGGMVVLLGLLVIFWVCIREKRHVLRPVLSFGSSAVAITLPWWIKNWYWTGNPFYPFFFHSVNSVQDAGIRIYQNAAPWGDWQDIFLLPWRATYMGIEGASGYGAAIGPLLLGLGILFWLGWRNRELFQRHLLEIAAIFSGFGILIWIIGNQFSSFLIQTRMYYPIFPAFGILAGAGYFSYSASNTPKLRFSVVMNAVVLLVLVLNLIEVGRTSIQKGTLEYLFGLDDQNTYLLKSVGYHIVAVDEMNKLPEGSKILMLFEPRSLYCAPGCLADDQLDRWKQTINTEQDLKAILAKWKAEGYSYILYCKIGADYMRASGDPHYVQGEWEALDNLIKLLPTPVDINGYYRLYSLP